MLSVSGALLVKLFGAETNEVARFAARAAEIGRLSLRQALVGRWFQVLLACYESIGTAVLFGLGGLLVLRGQIGLGAVVALGTLLKRLYGPARQLLPWI